MSSTEECRDGSRYSGRRDRDAFLGVSSADPPLGSVGEAHLGCIGGGSPRRQHVSNATRLAGSQKDDDDVEEDQDGIPEQWRVRMQQSRRVHWQWSSFHEIGRDPCLQTAQLSACAVQTVLITYCWRPCSVEVVDDCPFVQRARLALAVCTVGRPYE